MHKWWKQLRMEWLLLRRNGWPFLAFLAFGAWMAVDVMVVDEWSSPNVYVRLYDFSHFGQALTLGVAMLLGIFSIRRDTDARVVEMLQTWPYRNDLWVTAKYIAMLTYLSLYSLVMLVVAFVAYGRQGIPMGAAWKDIGFLFVQYELSYAVTLALGMALAAWIGHRIVYLIGFCAWMFGTFFMEFMLINRQQWHFLRIFHLSEIVNEALWTADTWGVALVSDELMRSRIFVLFFSLCLLSGVLLTFYRRRPGKGWRLSKMSVGVCMVGLIITGVAYGTVWTERISHYRADLVHYPDESDGREVDELSPETHFAQPDRLPFQVESYDLQVKKTGEREMAVQASLTVNPVDVRDEVKLVFTLNHTFVVKEVQVNGTPIDYERNWDTLAILRHHLPAGAGKWRIDITYVGEVFHYSMIPHHLSHFVVDDQVFLPYYMAWYPLPGEQTLYVVDERNHLIGQSSSIISGETHISLFLDGFSGKVYATLDAAGGEANRQSYRGHTADGLTLVAGNLTEVSYDDVRLITSPTNRPEGKQFLKHWHDQVMTYYDEWLFDDNRPRQIRTIYYLPLDHAIRHPMNWRDIGIETPLNGHWLLNDFQRLTAITDHGETDSFYLVSRMMKAYLFGDSSQFSTEAIDDEIVNVTGAVRAAYVYLYAREQFGESHDEALETVGGYMFEDPDVEITHEEQVLDMVGRAVDHGETAQVKRVLYDLYSSASEFDMYASTFDLEKGVTWDEWQRKWKEYGLK